MPKGFTLKVYANAVRLDANCTRTVWVGMAPPRYVDQRFPCRDVIAVPVHQAACRTRGQGPRAGVRPKRF